MNKTLEELYPGYIEYLSLKDKPTTIASINFKFKNYILPYFKKYKIKDISEEEYIKFLNKIKKLNYDTSFYNKIYSCFKGFYDYLGKFYDIKNVPEKVGRIVVTKDSNIEKTTWTKREFKKFIKKVDMPIYHALFNFLFYTGTRKGEALALKISDFKGDYIEINKTITKEYFNGERLILPPKSKKSIRKIRIDHKMKIELNGLLKYYTKEFGEYNSNFYLFGGVKPIAPTTLERKKNHYCKISNVKQIRIHDFRHSHASLLYSKGIDIKSIQERLGHSDISITLNTYIHNTEKQQKKLINMINLLRF